MSRLLGVGEYGVLQNMERYGHAQMNGATAVVTRAFGLHRRLRVSAARSNFAEGYGCDVVGFPESGQAVAKKLGLSLIGWFIERDQIRPVDNQDGSRARQREADLAA